MISGSSGNSLSAGPTFFDYVSLVWKINMMGVPVEIPLPTGIRDVEDRLIYWREDPGVNLYHWHWHMVHPFSGSDYSVRKDRRGELFYYLHHQILARYNVERLCHGMNLAQPLLDWDEPIAESYNPVLNAYISSKNFPARMAKMKMRNVNRKDLGLKIDVDELRLYRDRIFEAIYRKRAIAANGTEIPLDDDRGIDVLGNMVEASVLSPDENYYGSIHNDGHIIIALIHDPENKYKQTTGVMFKPNTAMRDPLFYTWHSFLDSFFEAHKASLPTYDENFLTFPDVQVTNVDLISYKDGQYGNEKNTLYTYMMKSDINMSRGLDFVPKRPILVRITHQNHDDFDYIIECVNNFQEQLLGTVRIFLLPLIGDDDAPMDLSEQRPLAIEMDKFVEPLKPGVNRIVRKSTMASVTIPFEQVFRDLDNNVPKENNYWDYNRFNFCGCGWPQYLLTPRGTAEGFPMLLFAMITDANADRVDPTGNVNSSPNGCKPSESVCGLVDKKYPDKRPVGFPFDRPPSNDAESIDDFLTPNMAIKPITIFHSDEVRPGRLLSDAEPLVLGKIQQQIKNLQDEQGRLVISDITSQYRLDGAHEVYKKMTTAAIYRKSLLNSTFCFSFIKSYNRGSSKVADIIQTLQNSVIEKQLQQ